MNRKRKLDYITIGNTIGFILSLAYILYVIWELLIYPFIIKRTTTLTLIGTLVLILTVYVNCECFNQIIKKIKKVRK